MLNLDNPPRSEVDRCLSWLRRLRSEIDGEIRALEAQKQAAAASRHGRAAFNALVRDLISKKCSDVEAQKRLVQQGYEPASTDEALRLLKRASAARRREMRDAEIVRRYLVNGESAIALAGEYGLTRKRVHEIVKRCNPLEHQRK